MSPSLLSKRLSEMEEAGIVEKRPATKGRGFHYFVTDSGKELSPVIFTLGIWGQKHVLSEFSKHELDPSLLMWDIHRRIHTPLFPEKGRFVVEFLIKGAPAERKNWWIIIHDRNVELCLQHPGHEIDLFIESNLRSLTNIWMGVCSINTAKKEKNITFSGNEKYIKNFPKWFLLSPFAEYYPERI
jgi:DNA-binding MarR family transcriptional regulator